MTTNIYIDIETYSHTDIPHCFFPENGYVISIAYAIDNEDIICILAEELKDEREILRDFWKVVGEVEDPLLIGHNILSFDLMYLLYRSKYYNIILPNFSVFDTITAKRRLNGKFYNLNDLAKELEVDMEKINSGMRVKELYDNCMFDCLEEYNKQDVRMTREIYKKLR